MVEGKETNSFDKELEEWLESKKKGFSGKIPRADFIAKIKEVNKLAEQLKKEKEQLSTKNKELETQLSTSLKKSEKQLLESKEKEQNLTTKLKEQEKLLQTQAGELSNLKKRPDITSDKYQELLNNQEKHQAEDLRPENLPTDWEQQLSDKKTIGENFADTEKKILALEEKLSANQKNFLEIEEKLAEAEKRPTLEQLEQEKEKYKDYAAIQKELAEKITAYKTLQAELERLKIELAQNGTKKPQKDNSELIIAEIKKLFAEQQSAEQELFNILKEISSNLFSLQSKIHSNYKNHTELPTNYEILKRENRELCVLLAEVKRNLPKDN